MEDGKDYIADDHLLISEGPPSEKTPLTFTRTTRVTGRNMNLADPDVPKIVLLTGAIVHFGDDEDDEMKLLSRRAVAIVMDPADGSGITFTHVLEFKLENEDAGHLDVLPYYSPVDSVGFRNDYDQFKRMIVRNTPVKRGLVHIGWQLPDTNRKEVWNHPPDEKSVDYTVTGLFDNKAQCFDMGKGFRLFVPGFMEESERTTPSFG